MAKPFKRAGSRFWWIAPWIDNRQVRQSSGETDYFKADKKLRILEGKIADRQPIRAQTDRETFGALLDLVVLNYKKKNRRSLYDLENRIQNHVRPYFGDMITAKVTSDLVDHYIDQRRTEGSKPPANATINRELAIIRRAFELGRRAGMVSAKPYIERLDEDNVREGYFDESQFRAVLRHGNALLNAILTVSYYTGWRSATVLGLEWRNIDLDGGIMRLFAKDTKNRKDAIMPIDLFPELRTCLEERRRITDETQKKNKTIIPQVFHRNGVPVKYINGAFKAACRAAGLPGKLKHDFRRTAVRNLTAAGWNPVEVKDMVGFRTMAIYLRYAIIVEQDIREKAARMAQKHKTS